MTVLGAQGAQLVAPLDAAYELRGQGVQKADEVARTAVLNVPAGPN